MLPSLRSYALKVVRPAAESRQSPFGGGAHVDGVSSLDVAKDLLRPYLLAEQGAGSGNHNDLKIDVGRQKELEATRGR